MDVSDLSARLLKHIHGLLYCKRHNLETHLIMRLGIVARFVFFSKQ
jgi:hypothetical protein